MQTCGFFNSQQSELNQFEPASTSGSANGLANTRWTVTEPTARQRLWGLLWLRDPATGARHRLDGILAEITTGILEISEWLPRLPSHVLNGRWSPTSFAHAPLVYIILSYFIWPASQNFGIEMGRPFLVARTCPIRAEQCWTQIQKAKWRSDLSDSFQRTYLDLPELHVFVCLSFAGHLFELQKYLTPSCVLVRFDVAFDFPIISNCHLELSVTILKL